MSSFSAAATLSAPRDSTPSSPGPVPTRRTAAAEEEEAGIPHETTPDTVAETDLASCFTAAEVDAELAIPPPPPLDDDASIDTPNTNTNNKTQRPPSRHRSPPPQYPASEASAAPPAFRPPPSFSSLFPTADQSTQQSSSSSSSSHVSPPDSVLEPSCEPHNPPVVDSPAAAAPAYAPPDQTPESSNSASAALRLQDETKQALPQDTKGSGSGSSGSSKDDEAEPPPAYSEGSSPLHSFTYLMAAAGGAASIITQVQQGGPALNPLGGRHMFWKGRVPVGGSRANFGLWQMFPAMRRL